MEKNSEFLDFVTKTEQIPRKQIISSSARYGFAKGGESKRFRAAGLGLDLHAVWGFRNLDHFLDALVLDAEFRALVVIDEETDDLHAVTKNLGFPVEIIEFTTYANEKGERIHRFDPFLADVEAVVEQTSSDEKRIPRDPSDLDTVVVPAREDGFKETFLGEDRWYAVRIHPTMTQQLKYIAAHVTAPISAITHYAPIRSIEPWKNTGKMVINFSEPAQKVRPLERVLTNGKVSHLQGLRYTKFEKLKSATSLDEAF